MRNYITPNTKKRDPSHHSGPKFRFVVQHILVSELAEWERHNEDIFVEQELARLAEKGDIHFLLPDGDDDITVILKVLTCSGL